MGLFGNMFLGLVHLFLVAVDVATLFAAARLIGMRKPWPVVVAFGKAGEPLTDALLRKIGLDRLTLRGAGSSIGVQIGFLLLILFLARSVISIVGGIIAGCV
jgi:hypothetical protein